MVQGNCIIVQKEAARIVNVCCAIHNVCLHYKVDEDVNDLCEVNTMDDAITEEIVPQIATQYLAVAQTIRENIGSTLQ